MSSAKNVTKHSVTSLLNNIGSGGVKARGAALDDLVFLLDRKGRNANFSVLEDKTYHQILESLFRCALTEKSLSLGGTQKAVASATQRLSKCAKAVRTVVEHGLGKLRRKTTLAIVDHITQTLPGPDEELIQPLVQDYVKALLVLLSRPANVEQLAKQSADGWESTVNFCIDAVTGYLSYVDQDAGALARASPAPGSAPLTRSSGRTSSDTGYKAPGYISQTTLLDLLECLHYLVLTPNAPVHRVAQAVSRPILRILRIKQMKLSRIQQFSFATLNTVLTRIQLDNLDLARSLTTDLLAIVSHWWYVQKVAKDEMLKAVRDEMIRTMFAMFLHLENLSGSNSREPIQREAEDLLDVLWSEYARRDASDQLQLGDINLGSIPTPADYFKTPIFSLQPHDKEGERKWGVLQSIAILEGILSRFNKKDQTQSVGGDEQPRKRRRMAHGPNRLRQKLKSPDPATQLTALQLIPFLVCGSLFPGDDAWDLLCDLLGLVSAKQASLASWAMLSAASCALRSDAANPALSSTWKQLWQTVARSVSLPGVSRAACVLLHTLLEADLVSYHVISNDINDMVTTADINGPAILTDSSLLLMLHLLQLRNLKLPSASQATCNHVTRWVFLKWNPADLSFASLHTPYIAAVDLVNLLRVACGAGLLRPSGSHPVPGGLISQAWRSYRASIEVGRYLLLLDDTELEPPSLLSCTHPALSDGGVQKADPSSFFTSRKLVLELLYPKIEELQTLCDTWNKKSTDGFSQISSERLQSLFMACICGTMILPQLMDLNTRQSRDIEPALFKLLDDALLAALDSLESQSFLDNLLRAIRPILPPISASHFNYLLAEHRPLLSLLSRLSRTLKEYTSRQSSGQNVDYMDIDDDDFDSQGSRSTSTTRFTDVPRQVLSLSLDSSAYYLETSIRLHLFEIISNDEGQVGLVPEAFLDQVVALSDEELLLGQNAILEVFRADLITNPNDAFRVVERIGSIIGVVPEYDCCEVALACCVNLIEALLSTWIDIKHQVADMVGDLYHHFVKTCLLSNQLSPDVQIALTRLLLSIMKVDTQYADKIGLSSCRSTLLSIERQGIMPVKFFVGANISDVFGLYVLKVHDDIFIDVLSSLPADPESMEGIAYRLFALAELACAWPTLLRRCIYHIFETPGNIPNSASYATRCLQKVSVALKLKSPSELFRLFAPQLLYTWLLDNSIDDIPYSIFGFASLRELIQASGSEAPALMIMRGPGDSIERLAGYLGKSPEDVVTENFSKIMAYAVAHGIARSKNRADPSSHDSGSRDASRNSDERGEGWVKKLLGSQSFIEAVYTNFADLVGHFMDLFDQEDPIEQYFVGPLSYAADILAEIKRSCHSEVGLPPNQQPVFKGRHLVRQLSHLCNLAPKYELTTLWTPALVVFVARKLINTVHPALGSLHACSVLRKLRILICLAGPVALSSYPLEMLLHSIRAFIVDSECADDAMGISQYLITKGTPHLEQSPSFLAGYALSTLASLRVFLESSQSSTTQESQFKATMSKAKQFHSWFSKYLTGYASPAFKTDAKQEAVFKSITQSAAHIRSSGNAHRGTHESNLLLEILRDEGQTDQLLNDSARDLALGLLCGDFKVPSSTQEDIVETDQEATVQAPVVWKSCVTQPLSDQYLAWAGRVAGRSFAASGIIPEELLQESRLSQYLRIAPGTNGSQRGLLHLLQGLTMNKSPATAGLAESALRSIVSEARAAQDDPLTVACQESLSETMFLASDWGEYYPPPSECPSLEPPIEGRLFVKENIEKENWVQRLCLYLARGASTHVIVLAVISPLLEEVKGFAEQAFPYILHLALLAQIDQQQVVKRKVSEAFKDWLSVSSANAKENQKLAINVLLYLRTQRLPNETSIADRANWLDIDVLSVAAAASRCGMHKTALLFVESSPTDSRQSRRASAARENDSSDLLLAIYENIDDPDAYYGLSQNSSLASVLARLEYEKDGAKSLAFRGAQYDSHIRMRDSSSEQDGKSLVRALTTLGLTGLSHSLLQTQQSLDGAPTSLETTFQTARRLEQWNLPVPASTTNYAVTVYKAYQTISQASEIVAIRKTIHEGFGETMRALSTRDYNVANLRQLLGALAVLSELDDILNAATLHDLEAVLDKFETRSRWMRSGRYDDVSHILSCRATTMSMLSQQTILRAKASLSPADARRMEIRSMLMSSDIYRFHQATQECLNLSTTLTDMIKPCEKLGLVVDAAVRMEAANSLWDHGEMTSSIGILLSIDQESSLKKQTVPVSRSELLSKIGHRVSVARLEKPHNIQKKYLEPALKELKGNSRGKEAGKVFHQFAMFCDEQLQSADGLEDLARLQNLRQGKSDEVMQLKDLIASTKETQLKNRYTSHLAKARQWLELDEQELRRVEQTRNEFVRLSLENYLLSLIASDSYNNDALRFTALWLEKAEDEATNEAVKKYFDKVPTRKFAPLMNQLTSRLQDDASLFQRLLFGMVLNICIDHPYHGMYHIWAGMNSRLNKRDDVAVSRHRATEKVAKHLATTREVAGTWQAIDKTSKYYHTLAADRNPERYKNGARLRLKDCPAAHNLLSCLVRYPIPPPTMQMELSMDKDYSKVPIIATLEPTMSIASGISAPKIITALGSDGVRYKQLVKGGNDDLRQDAIMEQVFAAVSSLLKLHRSTQQRNLGIRTYKVLPLTASSGLIEFVPNTIPLHEFLMPAHERYYPKDYKGGQCRREITNVQGKSVEVRVATYRKVTDRFRPVMRYFFMEYFVDPDEWYAKRLAYTRTTAAISMLGHILGLGDRHGHNILLDTKTGEVVHIDLGVAFEMGRVLPVPELVPFRLTRDIVDGMGITKTEGVFRRCCEFTLDALREETYSIMTILDVLRYDPLYSWSISPVRLAKLQDARRDDEGREELDEQEVEKNRRKGSRVNEPSEADRALEVVRKKLSKTLSVTATVNDLINQATDERNLAVLYSGWAAYA
ncbi:hypothetical protein jhhlp_000061 [Lomentospora prolificans]|uniref:Serine/threonine-protein kinase Tel1 n=1 Tax=Lomentospora prolificans TaxID=41688 RepID=A0A2N3NLH4_9PEZI|nr:hypothetical protein jhhlp_000061 [Lomentospora prolificans]